MEWCDSDAIWDVPPRRIIRTGMSLDRGLPVGYCCCGCCINHHPVSRDENNGRVGSLVRVVKNLTSADGYRMSTKTASLLRRTSRIRTMFLPRRGRIHDFVDCGRGGIWWRLNADLIEEESEKQKKNGEECIRSMPSSKMLTISWLEREV